MEEEKKCQCANKKIWLLFLIAIILVSGFFVYKNFKSEKKNVQVEKSPIEVVDNGDGTKTVRNVEDSLQVIVDNSWALKNGNNDSINLLKKGEGQPQEDTDLVDAINLGVNVLTRGENLDVNKWLIDESTLTEKEINSIELIEVSGTKLYIFEDFYDSDDFLPAGIENVVFNFMFVKDSRIINYSCNIITDKNKKDEYKEVCLELVIKNIK